MIDSLRRQGIGGVTLAVVVVALVATAGWISPTNKGFAFAVAALLLAVGFMLTAPLFLFAAVFAAVFAYWRVGPASVNLSISDAVTFLALGAALPHVPWRNRALRRVLAGLACYLTLLLVPVLANPTDRATTEWAHRALLFGGAVLIGAAIAHRHQIKNSLRALIGAASVVAVASIFEAITTGLDPAYPFGMHKNAAGVLLAVTAIVLIAAPWKAEIRPSLLRHVRILVIVGVFATQSRGAGLALVVAICIYALRHERARQRAPVFFMSIAIVLIIVSVATLQGEQRNNPKFNGVALRQDTIDVALNEVWANHPFTGGGLKYFAKTFNNSGGAEQIFVAELAEVGLIGLVGLLVLLANTLLLLRSRRDPMGEAAFLAFVVLLLYALTATFWVAGTLTLPMLIVGLAVGDDPSLPSSRESDSAFALS